MNKFNLDKLGSVNRGKSKHRPRNDPDLYGGKYPFIQTGDVKHSPFYVTSHTQTYNEKGLEQSKLWPVGTLCITIAANIADTAILTYPACFPDSIIGFLPNKDKADVKFVKYCLDTFKLQMQSISQGTTQDNMSLQKLLSIEFPIPALNEQQKIAAILSAYDDLIENNKRRIALQENMAEEIYREWFVRFRFPGWQDAEFEKGIPKGWTDVAISEIFDYLEGPGIRNWQYTESGFPFINIRLIQDGDIDPTKASYISESEAEGKYAHFQLQSQDYVVSTSGTLGRGAVVQEHHLPLLLNTSVIRFRARLPEVTPFMYGYLKSELFTKQIETYATGAAQQNFGPMHLRMMKIRLPKAEVLASFHKVGAPIYRQLSTLRSMNRSLSATKETLLPRLISGKLSVEDLDIQFPPSMQEDLAEKDAA